MYISKSIIEGLKILGFDKETIKKTAREKSVEEIFLSTLFLNYIIVLIAFVIGILKGGYSIGGRAIEPSVLYAILMIYPFFYNMVIYVIYGFFGLFAELVNPKKSIHPLLSVGFHTAIVFSVIIYVIGLIATIDLSFSIFLFVAFVFYFIYVMFNVMHVVYGFSLEQSLIAVLLPFLLLGFAIFVTFSVYPQLADRMFMALFI
jgi:hypothetical protein